jgi:hypothetical protein
MMNFTTTPQVSLLAEQGKLGQVRVDTMLRTIEVICQEHSSSMKHEAWRKS